MASIVCGCEIPRACNVRPSSSAALLTTLSCFSSRTWSSVKGRRAFGNGDVKTAIRLASQKGIGKYSRRRSRSEEHTSELQSRENLVCRLLLEKKNNH